MKKYFFLTAILAMYCFFVKAQSQEDWARFSKYEQANRTAPMGAVVFMGNSITEGWNRIHPEFFEKNNYICRGIGGQTSMQMLVRFRRDVIDLKPKVVVILAGTNDVAQNMGYISPENTLGNIISMAELAKANHIKVVLCSILPAYEFRWRKGLDPANKIIALNAMIKDYAEKNKIPYVDYHTVLKDERNGLPEKYAKDGVHPLSEGYDIMEGILKPVLDKLTK